MDENEICIEKNQIVWICYDIFDLKIVIVFNAETKLIQFSHWFERSEPHSEVLRPNKTVDSTSESSSEDIVEPVKACWASLSPFGENKLGWSFTWRSPSFPHDWKPSLTVDAQLVTYSQVERWTCASTLHTQNWILVYSGLCGVTSTRTKKIAPSLLDARYQFYDAVKCSFRATEFEQKVANFTLS